MLQNLQQKLNGIPEFLIWRGNHGGTVASLVGPARLCSIAIYSSRRAAIKGIVSSWWFCNGWLSLLIWAISQVSWACWCCPRVANPWVPNMRTRAVPATKDLPAAGTFLVRARSAWPAAQTKIQSRPCRVVLNTLVSCSIDTSKFDQLILPF